MTDAVTVRDHHDAAMLEVQDAIVARHQGNDAEYRRLHARALPHELAAIRTLEDASGIGPDTEPTRSILYLGAASIAWCAGDTAQAQSLIETALDGDGPYRVKTELLALLQEVVGYPK